MARMELPQHVSRSGRKLETWKYVLVCSSLRFNRYLERLGREVKQREIVKRLLETRQNQVSLRDCLKRRPFRNKDIHYTEWEKVFGRH